MALQPIIFGEVLFDVFAPDQAVLGGAPFNVAWHLQGLGMAPVFISRIGQDVYGEQIRSAMQTWGMTTLGLQVDPQHQTGMVQVSLQDGQPCFEILADVAYDHIDLTAAANALINIPQALFYHGSLVARTSHSGKVVKSLRDRADTVFVDINLRAPWWSREQVETLIRHADILKVNDDELAILMATDVNLEQLENAARTMQEQYQLKRIIVTRGEHGAFLLSRNELIHSAPAGLEQLVDTVGAGDGFSAVCIVGNILGWDEQTTLNRAAEFAAQICQQRGATSTNPAMYQDFKTRWSM